MDPQLRAVFFSGLLGTLGGLLSNVVANYLTPLFEQRRWLAVALFGLVTVGLLLFDLYQRGLWSPWNDTLTGLTCRDRNRLLALLLPLLERENERRALLYQVLGENPIYHEIDYSGATRPFTLNLLRRLAADTPALLATLALVHDQIGVEQQAQLQAIQDRLQQPVVSKVGSGWRRLGIAALLVLLGAVVWFIAPWTGDAVAQAAPSCPAARICIAISSFKPQGNQAANEAADQIEQAMGRVFAASESERFVVRRIELMVDNGEHARTQARADGDLLLVWGQLFTTQDSPAPLTVNFEFADPMGVEAQSTSPYRALPLQPIGDKLYCTQCLVGAATQQAEIVAYMAAGLAHYVRGQPRRARLDFTAALYCAGELDRETIAGSSFPDCTPAAQIAGKLSLLYYYLGKAYFLEGDYPHALAYLEQARQRNPQDLATLVGLAATYKAWRIPPDAASDPKSIQLGLENSAASLVQAQQLAEALRSQMPPDMAPVIDFDLGLFYEVVEETEAAQIAYRQAAVGFGESQKSGQYVALIGLARILAEGGERDVARATLEQTRTLASFLPWAYLALARLDGDDRPQAEVWLKQAEPLVMSDDVAVDVTRAELCTQWQDYACAAQSDTRALEKQPENGRIRSLVGNFYRPDLHPQSNVKSWQVAAQHYQQVADVMRPQDPWAHQRLAYVLQNMQDDAGAIEHYQAAIKRLHPEMQTSPSDLIAAIYCNLGVSLERSGKKTEARQSYEQCEQLAATDAQRAHAHALLQAMNGQ